MDDTPQNHPRELGELGDPQSPPEATAPDESTYELQAAPQTPPRNDLKILKHPPRWCLACGRDLTLVLEDPVCPRCEKKFDPNNPETYSPEPVSVSGNWWLQPPRVAGYVLLPLFLTGRLVTAAVAEDWVSGIQGTSSQTTAGNSAGLILSAMMIFFAFVPWIAACVLLALGGVSEHFNPKPTVAVPLGLAFALLITAGLAPAAMLIAACTGPLAGLIYAWQAG